MKHLPVKSSHSLLSLQGEARVGLLFLLSFFFLFSCTKDDIEERSSGATGEVISRQLRISAMPMLNTFSATTNRSIESESAMDAIYAATTRATGVELSQAEKELKSVHVLQFSGTESGSLLIKIGDDIASALNSNDGTIDYEFESNEKMQRIYTVANMDIKGFTEDKTTLKQFEESVKTFACTTSVPTTGLPMCGYQDFNPSTDYPASFTLKVLVSKLIFQYSLPNDLKIEKAKLRNIPSGYTVKQAVAGTEASQPTGINFNATFDLSTANEKQIQCYLPANLAGQGATIVKEIDRSQKKAPANATFVEIIPSRGDGMWAYYLALGNGQAEDFNVAGGHSYTITALIKGTNELDKRVVKFTNLNSTKTKEGVPATANCYVIEKQGGKYFFDGTIKGNGALTPAVKMEANKNQWDAPAIDGTKKIAPISARILWETGKVVNNAIKNVDMTASGRIFFESPSGTVGNTIIAALNTGGGILWSWHIWKPEALEEWDAVKWNDTTDGDVHFKMLDRNLGATTAAPGLITSYGLTYQWGRKDPFPGAGMPAADITPNGIITDMRNVSGVTVDYTISNPTTYTGASSQSFADMDWMTNGGHLNNLWGTPLSDEVVITSNRRYNSNKGSKSIYDPCPIGYRVPPGDVMSKLYQQNGTKNTHRQVENALVLDALSPNIYLPLAGYSGEYSGPYGFTYVKQLAVFWTSSPALKAKAVKGQMLELYPNNLQIGQDASGSRGCSGSVRCISETTE